MSFLSLKTKQKKQKQKKKEKKKEKTQKNWVLISTHHSSTEGIMIFLTKDF
jgi:3-deoxy-D-manno-octulosonic-acid transferase